MHIRSLLIMALGGAIAFGTALSLHHRLKRDETAPAATQVLVAATDIPAGSFLREGQLVLADWPAANISDAMLTSATVKVTDYNGAVARRAIAKGEPIVKTTLVRSHEGGFMAAVLEPGHRAVSIPVDATTGNAGFIFPGDRVDLILTHTVRNPAAGEMRASETFIEDVRVLAVDQSLDNPQNKAVLAKTVTLEVSPKQAEEINVAKDLGHISLSLRSLARPQESVENLDDLLKENIAKEQAKLAPQPAQPTVTRDTDVSQVIQPENAAGARVLVIRGNERSEILFGAAAEAPRAQ